MSFDPAHGYLPYATQVKHPNLSGDTYSFSVTKQGQTGKFSYTVNGQYVSQISLTAPNGIQSGWTSRSSVRHLRWHSPPGPRSSAPSGAGGTEHRQDTQPPATGRNGQSPPDAAAAVPHGPTFRRLVDGLRSARALAFGSGASVSQRTATKWRAPTPSMGATVVGSAPPVTQTVHGARRTASLT